MRNIEKKEIKQVVAIVGGSNTRILSPIQLCVYIVYRIESRLSADITLSEFELFNSLTEVGPGNKRIDPLKLEIVMQSQAFKEMITFQEFQFDGIKFYAYKNTPKENLQKILKMKSSLITPILKSLSAENDLINISNKIENEVKKFDFKVVEKLIKLEEQYADFFLSKEDVKLQLRFYNSLNWIYPYTKSLWSFINSAHANGSIPLFIAPKIHGSCFFIFKWLGVYAREVYFRLINSEQNSLIKETILKNHLFHFNMTRFESFEAIDSLKQISDLLIRSEKSTQSNDKQLPDEYLPLSSETIEKKVKEIIKICSFPPFKKIPQLREVSRSYHELFNRLK